MATIKFAGKDYPGDIKLSDLVKRLEVEHGFRINAKQFDKVIHGKELNAQEILDLC